jgi:hypothetical protein
VGIGTTTSYSFGARPSIVLQGLSLKADIAMRQMSRPRGDLEHLVAFVPQHDGEGYSGMRVVVRNEDAQRSISPEGDTW